MVSRTPSVRVHIHKGTHATIVTIFTLNLYQIEVLNLIVDQKLSSNIQGRAQII